MIAAMALGQMSCTKKPELKALIVTGQNNHNWQRSNVFLRQILEKSQIFTVETSTSPAAGRDMSEFIIDFSPYDVVVLDYTGDNWPEETRNNFLEYVSGGGGVVVYHAASNAFPDWPEFNEIIGLGGWGGRNEDSGPYVYVEDGQVVRDDSPGRGGSHGRQHEFMVEAFMPTHPILKGLPEKWMQTQDELYDRLRGPAKNLEVLAYAFSDEDTGGSGRNEPVLMTITYGDGRIFHTALGHAGNSDIFAVAMESAGFIVTLQRGAEWAATGKVTQKPPVNFPTESESLRWEFLEDVTNLKPIVERMQEYEIGKSNDGFLILAKLISDNSHDELKMKEYQSVILDLLRSRKTTVESKKILLKNFSWLANDSFRDVFVSLGENPELADDARYALGVIGE